jgi:hypothetical protein
MKYTEYKRKQKNPPGAGMVVFCIVSKDKTQNQDNQHKETRTDEVNRVQENIKNKSGRGMDVCLSVSCECCVLSGRGLCDGPIPRQLNVLLQPFLY